MSNLEKKAVSKVINVLNRLGHSEKVIELKDTARSALDASIALKVPVGAIVKTLIFIIMILVLLFLYIIDFDLSIFT